MFGSKKIQELESQLSSANGKLEQANKEKEELKSSLEAAQSKISELEAKLSNTNALEKQARATIAEYEGLKDLYSRKIDEFESSREEKEQEFARHSAIQRFDLENEIKENREANQNYVSETVKTFSDSYNYYLNQIKLLMDALSDVASHAGEVLFSEPNDDLKTRIGQQMAEKVKAETDPLRNEDGDLILIGSPEEEIPADSDEEADAEVDAETEEAAAEADEAADAEAEEAAVEADEAAAEADEAAAEADEAADAEAEEAAVEADETAAEAEAVEEAEAESDAESNEDTASNSNEDTASDSNEDADAENS